MLKSPTNPASTTKTLLDGRFEVNRNQEIGRGGIAVVYRGVDVNTGESIAAKQPLEHFRRNDAVLRRFNNESRMNNFISPHPHVVRWVDYVEDGPWIVMEFVDGRDLKQIIRDRGPLPLNEAVHYLGQIASALDHMHDRSVAHLDIKPQNLLIGARRRVTLIDFGLAQEFAQKQDTIGKDLFGTAAYMAPEQANFQPIGGYTDVYSLGCVFHEMVTGSPPFVAEGLAGEDEQRALLEMHRTVEPTPPSKVRPDLNLPVWVDDVVGRAMEKEPEHRFHSVGAFGEAARRGRVGKRAALDSRPVTPVATSVVAPAPSPPPSEADERDVEDVEPRGPGLGRRMWNAGGRRLQNSTHARAIAWRLSLLSAIVALVATLNVASDGSLTQLVSLGVEAGPAITTDVTNGVNNIRSEPTTNSMILTTVSTGDSVEIIGMPTDGDTREWWPVKVQVDGNTVEGWIHSNGLETSRWMNVLGFPDTFSDTFDSLTGWWP